MINVVIPMAGLGSRFSNAGYEIPKPFIDVAGKPMIERVLDNLTAPEVKFTLLARDEHISDYSHHVTSIKQKYNAEFFPISNLTQGPACTVLLARKLISDDTPLVIANSDQIIDIDFNHFIQDARARNLDGSIITFKSKDPKWSFAKLNKHSFVTEVQEKNPISDHATVGIYYFKMGYDFIEGAIDMMLEQDTVNREYYTCPVYNYLIRKKSIVGVYEITVNQMNGIGTPKDLCAYLTRLSGHN